MVQIDELICSHGLVQPPTRRPFLGAQKINHDLLGDEKNLGQEVRESYPKGPKRPPRLK